MATSVDQLISDAKGYSSQVLTQATSALAEAKSAIANVGYMLVGSPGLDLPQEPDVELDIAPPELTDVELNVPQTPTNTHQFITLGTIEAGSEPYLSIVAPELVMPTKPNQVAEFNESAPTLTTSFEFPEPPGELSSPLGPAPEITALTLPVKPNVSLPSLNAVMPTDNTVVPTDLDQKMAAAYSTASPQMTTMINGYIDAMMAKYNPQYHSQMSAIENQLTTYLRGGTGLNPAVENAIYERSRSKTNAEANRVRAQAWDEAAARGFTIPNGALLSAVQTARQAGADMNATAAREIVVMQAEMEQKNLQFAVSTSGSLRTTLLNTTMMYMQNLTSINSQALDYAKSVLNAVIETYNTALKAFNTRLDAYKAEAAVYEVKMKGAMMGIEVYQAEIKALEALVNIDRARIDVYRARIDSLTAYAGLYKAQIEAVLGRASLEKLKMDLFQAKVQAYSSKVQAKAAEWQGYTAAIEGESAKTRMYGARVEAFNAEVNAFKAKIDAKAEVIKAQAMSNEAISRQYSAQLQSYSTTISANAEVAKTKLENQRQKVVAFQAQTAAAVAQFQVKSEYYKSVAQVSIENAKLLVSTTQQSADTMRKYGESLAHLSISSASVYGQLAGAAMSGMNSMASYTLSE